MFRYISIFFLFCAFPLSAQTSDSTLLTLERIFSSDEFSPKFFGPARWLSDGNGYTTLEPSASASGGRDIVRYDVEKGTREVLVAVEKLIPEGAAKPLRLNNYQWSPDAKSLLIFTNTKKVWRINTRGDYWILNLGTWKLRKIGGNAPASSLMFAKFSPDGRKVGYVSEHNIFVEDIETGQIKQLTTDGSNTMINGTFDWVYEEEFECRDGFRWSPDSKSIAYWQLDASGIGVFYMINNTDSVYSKIIPVQYPKAGEKNSACRVGVVSAEGGATTWMDVPGDPRDNYIPRMEWSGTSDAIVMRHLNRLQNEMQIMLGDIHTGKVQTILTDRDSAWVDVWLDFNNLDNEFKVLEGGKGFLFFSERDGWRHVYQVSRDGKKLTSLTPGNFDVIKVLQANEKDNMLYYVASPDNATQRFLFRVKMDGKGKAERLTAAKEGTHNYQISPNSKWAIHSYSSMESPIVYELVQLPNHKTVRTLEANDNLRKKLAAIKKHPAEFFKVNIGNGLELDGWRIKPFDFDSTKRYPLFIAVYGEPAAQTVTDSWGYDDYLWNVMLAQQGYIVCSVDNRGTPAPRGREWRKCIYKQLGYLGPIDEAAAVRVMRQWKYVDSTRVGIWGWSGGAASTLQAMFRFPELYQTGMAVAPVTDQHYYDNIYTERYMSLPKENEEGYKKSAPITYANGLKGNLLLVHGTGDDNVHFQNSERLVNALIAANKTFTFMPYPNRTHGIYEGEGTTMHLRSLLTRYLKEHLPAGPR
jgi:dipeptidyl-peptidase-4